MSEGNQNVLKIIDHVKEQIELCIQKYMSLEETMTYLEKNHLIRHQITISIWEHLQRESPNFFIEYNKRCEVARQIAKFNDLLARQIDWMHSSLRQVTKLQKVNDDHQDQIYDHWIASNGISNREEAISCVIDTPAFVATPQPDAFTPFVATPQSDDALKYGFRYDIDFDDAEQFARDFDEQQQRLELKFQRDQQPQQPVDQQEVYVHQQHEFTTLQEELSIKNKNLQGDGPTTTMAQLQHMVSASKQQNHINQSGISLFDEEVERI